MRAAAERIVSCASAAIAARGRFSWVLSGGNTPQRLYMLLATKDYASRIDWARVHFFWGDERCVPPDHPDSNYRMARESLFDVVKPPPENVHRMHGEREPAQAAEAYAAVLREFFGLPGGVPPHFDLILLGMGDDGHTASLFPGSAALLEEERWVVANWAEKLGTWRLTFTLPVLNAARRVAFLVAGADKAGRLAQLFSREPGGAPLPAQLVRPASGEAEWCVDAQAGANLGQAS
jgi:6-phosphogluconolactonase